MKSIINSILLLTIFCIFSCEESETSVNNIKQHNVTSLLVKNSGCKNNLKLTNEQKEISKNVSCVEYS